MEASLSRKPVVSVILPAYNSEQFLVEAIESVISQTYTDWELLILDDASPDDSGKIAKSYAKVDPRIRLLENAENMGVAKTRNRGVANARGIWIAFLDSDDIWHSEKLELQLERAAQTGAQIIYSSYAMVSEDLTNKKVYMVPSTIDYAGMLRENVIGCSTVLAAANLMKEHPFPTDIYHEDYALWLNLLRVGASVAGCTQVLVDWRVTHAGRSFNKRIAAKHRWNIYRKAERLPFMKSARVFCIYAIRGIAKHKRL